MLTRLSFILFLFWPALVFGQGRGPQLPPDTAFVRISADRCLYRAVEDDHGGFYAIWTQPTTDGYSLWAQHIGSSQHALWGTPGVPLAAHLDDAGHWDVWADGKGGLAAAWVDHSHIQAQRFATENGKGQWASAQVSVSTAAQLTPAGTPDAGGGSLITWSEKYKGRTVLMAQHLNGMGVPLWSVLGQRVSRRPSNQERPTIVFDGQAGAIVAWKDFRSEASQMMAQRLDGQGTLLWGNEGVVVTAPANTLDQRPTLAAAGHGQVVIVWAGNEAGINRLRLQRFNPTGQPLWAQEGAVVSYGSWDQWNPYAIGDGQNGIWVGWEDYRDGHNWKVYMLDLTELGKSGWETGEVQVALAPGNQGRFYITEDGNKGFLCAWVDERTGSPQIYFQGIDPQGRRLLGDRGIVVSTPMKDPQKPHMASLGNGRAGLIWADKTAKHEWALYWKVASPPEK